MASTAVFTSPTPVTTNLSESGTRSLMRCTRTLPSMPGITKVRHHDIELLPLEALERFLTGTGGDDLVALLGEQILDEGAEVELDRRRRGFAPWPCPSPDDRLGRSLSGTRFPTRSGQAA